MADDQKTAADVERLQHTLTRERAAHRETKRLLVQIQRDLRQRIEALEQAGTAPNVGAITSALAQIRADLRAEQAAMRAAVDELDEELQQFIRMPH